MSYILDALRKADAQRLRDSGRGIHAQGAAPGPGVVRSGRPVIAIAAGVAATLLLVGAWLWDAGESVAPVSPPRPAEVRAIAALPIATRAEPADAVLPPPAAPIVQAPAAARPEAAAIAARRSTRPATPVVAAPGGTPAAGPAGAVATAPATAPGAVTPVPSPPAIAASNATADRVYALTELSSDVRQALPKLAVSGGVFSQNVAQRMLVVNGQVFNEGSEIAPGVVLEQIRERVAVLRFRGLRIAQPY
jgi:general secretion pathway protein B